MGHVYLERTVNHAVTHTGVIIGSIMETEN